MANIKIKELQEKSSNLSNLFTITDDGTITYKTKISDLLASMNTGFSGKYSDLTGKPNIPSKLSQLTNDAGFITSADIPSASGDMLKSVYDPSNKRSNVYDYNAFINTPDLSIYATKTYVDSVIGSGGSVDLTDYAKKSELFSKKYSDLINKPDLSIYLTAHQSIAHLASIDYVDGKLSDLDIPEVDLSAYAKKSELFSKKYSDLTGKPDLTNYLTEHQDISHLASKTEIPTKVSQLTNDKKYLTEHQSLANYALKSELFDKDYNKLINKPTIPSIEGLASETYVDNKFGTIDLTPYAKKTELFSKKYSDLTGTPNLDIYLTEHQDISHLASKEYVDNEIANIDIGDLDISDLATKDEVELKADLSYVNDLVKKPVPANAKFTDTTYNTATSSKSGLMSPNDKVKLDGLNFEVVTKLPIIPHPNTFYFVKE